MPVRMYVVVARATGCRALSVSAFLEVGVVGFSLEEPRNTEVHLEH